MEKKDIIIIGGSAGSIEVMMRILPLIPANFPIPVILVLHRKSSTENITASVFQSKSEITIIEAEDKMKIESGYIYLAPSGYHLLFEKDKSFSMDFSEKVNYSRPSIDVSMESIVDVYKNKIIGILLTGANSDGAKGLRHIKEAGGLTIIQSIDSSIMAEMPLAALKLFEPNKMLNPEEIALFLININKN